MHLHAALGERQRDPSGSDPELQCSSLADDVGQVGNDRLDHGGIRLVGISLVVARCYLLVEEAVVPHAQR